MNMRAQLMIDQYLMANRDCLLDELYQNVLLTGAGPCVAAITHFAAEDAQGLQCVLQKDELAVLRELIRFHQGKPTVHIVVYWVTFYLSIARGQNAGWALRCAIHPDTLPIDCNALDNLLKFI